MLIQDLWRMSEFLCVPVGPRRIWCILFLWCLSMGEWQGHHKSKQTREGRRHSQHLLPAEVKLVNFCVNIFTLGYFLVWFLGKALALNIFFPFLKILTWISQLSRTHSFRFLDYLCTQKWYYTWYLNLFNTNKGKRFLCSQPFWHQMCGVFTLRNSLILYRHQPGILQFSSVLTLSGLSTDPTE